MTRRRWIADTWNDTTATLEGDQAHHLIRVLRAQPGMEFDVVAGGHAWRARIESIERAAVHFELVQELEAAASLPITLLLSVFKYDRMEWAIEKAVELGCARIVPLLAERSEKHLAQAALRRVERWRRIALEAAKQSRRSDLPEIADPITLKQALDLATAPEGEGDGVAPLRILLAETEEDQSLLRILGGEAGSPRNSSEVWLAIGPEGGWTTAELVMFTQAGWQSVSLGPRILRAETAAIAALAVVSAWSANG